MFIVWGTKVVKRRFGRVADFCQICRKHQPFRMTAIETVSHVNYIPLGNRKLHGFIKTCEVCKLALNAGTGDHEFISQERNEDLETLIAATNPGISEKYGKRLELEKRVRQGSLTPEERGALILEPFFLLNSSIKSANSLELDTANGLGCLATVAIPIALAILVAATTSLPSENIKEAALVVGLVLAVITLYLFITTGRRHARRVIIPQLAKTLKPLNPTLEELEETISYLKQQRLPIGQKIKAQALFEELQVPTYAEDS